MQPAELLGEGRDFLVVANYGLCVKEVFEGDKDETQDEDERGCLMMKSEDRTVDGVSLLLEPLSNLLNDGKGIFDIWRSHGLNKGSFVSCV